MKFFENTKPYWYLFYKHNHLQSKAKLSLLACMVQLFFLKRTAKNKVVKINFWKYKIHTPNAETLSILLKEKFIFEEYFFESENKNPVIIDIGSSIGISVLYFKTLYPHSTIYAFEPNPNTFSFLKENVMVNEIKAVYLEEAAISGATGKANLNIHQPNPYLNSYIEETASTTTISVNSDQLSSYIHNCAHIDLVKLDVEGKEVEIINDLYNTQLLKKGVVKNFIIEYHYTYQGNKENLQHFLSLFENTGYLVHKRFSMYPNNNDAEIFFFTHQ